jgi:hypothetical protein
MIRNTRYDANHARNDSLRIIFTVFRREFAKIFPKTFSKIGWTVESDIIGDLSNCGALIFNEFGSAFQPESTYEAHCGLPGQCFDLPVQLYPSQADSQA